MPRKPLKTVPWPSLSPYFLHQHLFRLSPAVLVLGWPQFYFSAPPSRESAAWLEAPGWKKGAGQLDRGGGQAGIICIYI